jgi:NADPH:quinone reductase-like Zn-dependent oxidoreductase
MIAAAPTSINALEGASVAVTAWEMLFMHADLKSGETVLIQGASGNVAGFAVQLARSFRTYVSILTFKSDKVIIGAYRPNGTESRSTAASVITTGASLLGWSAHTI